MTTAEICCCLRRGGTTRATIAACGFSFVAARAAASLSVSRRMDLSDYDSLLCDLLRAQAAWDALTAAEDIPAREESREWRDRFAAIRAERRMRRERPWELSPATPKR